MAFVATAEKSQKKCLENMTLSSSSRLENLSNQYAALRITLNNNCILHADIKFIR